MNKVKRRYGVLAAAVVPLAVVAASASWAQGEDPRNGFDDKAGGSVLCDTDEGVVHWSGDFIAENLTALSPAEAIKAAVYIDGEPLASTVRSGQAIAASSRAQGGDWKPSGNIDLHANDGGEESFEAVSVLFESADGDVGVQATISRIGNAWVLDHYVGCESEVSGTRSASRLLAAVEPAIEED